ncbi:Outer membrane protein [Saliniradius amylolyticus]|uniref:Outer membrane protein n=1 Tax=Saliniradius amylolyticus TaxID=2183582 RepID=A0A2S2E0B5_9ALTE|nr:OmpW family outer membrane protein [Saliniradius amylolyticus]AWL11084.1 Outer membrane protein [Saliniradius amylolyticus]
MKKQLTAALLLGSLSFASQAQSSDWTLRVHGAHISPNDDSSQVLGNDGVGVDSASGLAFSISKAINRDWSVELQAALPFSHDINGTGAIDGLPIGDTKHLPPTLNALYHLNDVWHLGLGVNYTLFFDEQTSDALTNALGADSTALKLDDSVGLAAKVGFDYPLTENWSLSGGVYYMDIDTDADVLVNGEVATTVDVEIDPWVALFGISTKF